MKSKREGIAMNPKHNIEASLFSVDLEIYFNLYIFKMLKVEFSAFSKSTEPLNQFCKC